MVDHILDAVSRVPDVSVPEDSAGIQHSVDITQQVFPFPTNISIGDDFHEDAMHLMIWLLVRKHNLLL